MLLCFLMARNTHFQSMGCVGIRCLHIVVRRLPCGGSQWWNRHTPQKCIAHFTMCLWGEAGPSLTLCICVCVCVSLNTSLTFVFFALFLLWDTVKSGHTHTHTHSVVLRAGWRGGSHYLCLLSLARFLTGTGAEQESNVSSAPAIYHFLLIQKHTHG